MRQPGFFDIDERYAALQQHAVGELRRICSKVHHKELKSPAGRKPLDPVIMFKALVLQSLYNISDQQMEYQIKDRMSFMFGFWGLIWKTRCWIRPRCGHIGRRLPTRGCLRLCLSASIPI